MYDPSLCDNCGECLAKCHYLDFDEKSGGQAILALYNGEDSPWIISCITCFGCNEYCTRAAMPFDLIVSRMEESGKYLDPALVDMMHGHFSPKGDFAAPEVKGRAISLCTIYSVLPKDCFDGKLFDGLTPLKGRFFFCHILYPHLGNMSLFEKEMPGVIERLAATGADEIIFVHDDCFAMIQMAQNKGMELPFKATHIIEYLLEYVNENAADVKPLDMKIAYQRPCASRMSPEKEGALDKLFDKIGVTRVARKFDREKALCCGENSGGAIPARAGQEEFQDKNIQDAVDHNASAMVFLCPMCMGALGKKAEEKGLKNIFITDLVKMAVGEKDF